MKSNERKMIKRGDCILTETPFAYVLKSKYRKERCDYCLKSTKVLKCSNCQYVNYCGQECQRKAWTLHKIECPMLKSIYPRNVPDAARMLCRLIIKLNKGGDLERSYYTEKCSRRFRDLMSHYAEIKNDAKRLEHLESLYMVLAEMMNGTGLLPNQTELLGIYGRLITNGFNILDGEMNVIGTGIYMGVSVTDHSCVPNAVATFEGTTLHIYAIADIECLDWSKIFISYIDLLSTTEQRRRDLKENYYFLCVCSKCIDPNELEEITGAACPNVDCSEMVNIEAHECSSCKAAISSSYRSNFNEVLQFTQDKLAEMRDIAFLDVCKICLKKQKQLLHPLNLWHIKTLDAAFEAAIEVGKWSDALEYGRKLLPGFRKYYGDWNPLLGLLYLKIGKIQLYIEQQKAAIDNFQEAKKILTITHGAGHSLLREALMPMLMQAVAESK